MKNVLSWALRCLNMCFTRIIEVWILIKVQFITSKNVKYILIEVIAVEIIGTFINIIYFIEV